MKKLPLMILHMLISLFAVSQNNPSTKKMLRKTQGTIYLNLGQATGGAGYLDVPVSFISSDTIISLDLATKLNEQVLTYNSVINPVSYLTDALANYSEDDRTLRFTSNSRQRYEEDKTIVYIRFNTFSGKVTSTDFSEYTGYLNGDIVNLEITGSSKLYNGKLKFWTGNNFIRYNPLHPSQYLITNIYGTDPNCANTSTVAVQPDTNGQFSFNTTNGSSIRLERDILSSANVQQVINGFDAGIGHKILVNDRNFIPSIFQLIALDVNMDGVVSAGDISQLNQRSVKTINEFKQKWNYGTSTNTAFSKDWVFVDSTLLASPAFKKSSTYPFNDGQGYSKLHVPVVPFCLQLPVSKAISCNTCTKYIYIGILLGDADGNYDAVEPDGQIKKLAMIGKKNRSKFNGRTR